MTQGAHSLANLLLQETDPGIKEQALVRGP